MYNNKEHIISFITIESLKEYLLSKEVDINNWKKIRTVENLFSELINKESYITEKDNKVIRNIEVICLKITYKDKLLLQYKQVFKSKEKNLTLKLPSEKAVIGENLEKTCTRLLKEELNILENLNFQYIESKKELTPAYAYPGIYNEINLRYYETQLPESFKVLKYYKEVTQKQTTYFKWFELKYLKDIIM